MILCTECGKQVIMPHPLFECTWDKEFDSEEKRIVADRYDLSMNTEKALALEFIAMRRVILLVGFMQTDMYGNYLSDDEKKAYKGLIQ